jgi:GNAT superfamily N-acetyltransferase
LEEGAGVTTPRGDTHYVVTEYGVAELHGKSIMQRALALINIAHPKFRDELLAHAKALRLIYQDVSDTAFKVTYPEQYESVARLGEMVVYFRPARATDEQLLHELFYSFSDLTVYQRYMAPKKRFSHLELQSVVNVDYYTRMTLIAFIKERDVWRAIGLSTWDLDKESNSAEVAFIVGDRWQGRGVGSHLMEQMVRIGRDKSLKYFTAETLVENNRMLELFYRTGHKVETRLVEDTYLVKMDIWSK